MGENEEDFEDFVSSIFFEAQEYFAFESRLDFFFLNGHICNVTNVVNYNVDVHNVVSTLI